ncbi:MAG TPA: hypothetical protein DD381_11165 [Lentisphaeria bacterium]|nr:MAG: hypothetical protein A2X47_00435 [Lentisphaerae bacterium GWF2_38_69]HBM16888.1 hypothetical protein [Lentisphaeria bacterium]
MCNYKLKLFFSILFLAPFTLLLSDENIENYLNTPDYSSTLKTIPEQDLKKYTEAQDKYFASMNKVVEENNLNNWTDTAINQEANSASVNSEFNNFNYINQDNISENILADTSIDQSKPSEASFNYSNYRELNNNIENISNQLSDK